MRLQTVSGAPVDYPDLPRDAAVCVEIVSALPPRDVGGLVDELRALCAASLAVQIKAGKPVVKLLNLTGLAVRPDFAERVESMLNVLAGLVQDPAFAPLVLLREAIAEVSPRFDERFGSLPQELERIDAFIRALGLESSTPELTRPSIHVALDQAGSPGAHLGGVQLRPATTSPVLAGVAHWWTDHDSSTSARLCRPDFNKELIGPRALVPLRYVRDAAVTGVDGVTKRAIRPVIGKDAPGGFSLCCNGDAAGAAEYRRVLLAATFECVGELLERLPVVESPWRRAMKPTAPESA
ncbi:MAG TPA: hypothetical protein VED84_01050 [Acidimicrobiales bacterium]|nr:hypothetical protein [Acidimicrobiales bacterium]